MTEYKIMDDPSQLIVPMADNAARWIWNAETGTLDFDLRPPESYVSGSFVAGYLPQGVDRRLILQLSLDWWETIKDDVEIVQSELRVACGGDLKPKSQQDAEQRIKTALTEFVAILNRWAGFE